MNNNLTFAEKAMIEQILNDRKEDKLEPEFEVRIDKILEKFHAGESADMTYFERMIVIQQIELKLETKLEKIVADKFEKIRKKLLDI
jgi:hypothetical protein